MGKNVIYPEGKVYQSPPKSDFYCSINDGFLIKRKAFLDIKCDEELMANEDADFGLRFLKKYKLGQIDEPLMTVYGSNIINTTSYSDYSDRHLKGLEQFLNKNLKELRRNPVEGSYFCRMVGRMFYLRGFKNIAIGHLNNGFLVNKTLRNWLHWKMAQLGAYRQFYWLEQKLARYKRIYLK